MPTVTVDLAKAHMNLDHDADNALIELYIEAAEQFLGNHIGKHPSAFTPVPADLRLAVLRLVASTTATASPLSPVPRCRSRPSASFPRPKTTA